MEGFPMDAGRTKAGFAALGLVLAVAGCGGKSSKQLLPGAVYAASVVKVYKNAELRDMMGSDSYGDEPDSHMKGQSWFFTVKDPKEKVLVFYEQRFPGAERTTNEDGSVTFRIIPPGAEKYESVYVTVRDGEVQIGERCRPEKIKD
jgi:hypothetical protein